MAIAFSASSSSLSSSVHALRFHRDLIELFLDKNGNRLELRGKIPRNNDTLIERETNDIKVDDLNSLPLPPN